jgi:hypothetical protein
MHYILRYNKSIGCAILEQITRLKKGLVLCLKNNGMTTLKRHVDASHGQIANKFEEKMNISLKSHWKYYLQKKACNECNCNLEKIWGLLFLNIINIRFFVWIIWVYSLLKTICPFINLLIIFG